MNIKKLIEESNAIEGITNPDEIEQSLVAWRYLLKQKEITHYDICRVQKIITINQSLRPDQRGYYRNVSQTNVRVGKHRAPDYKVVEDLMISWLNDLPKMSPLVAHIRFEHIHPFADGNGRTGRMIYWWHCKQLGKEPKKYTAKDKRRYYALFDAKRVKNLLDKNWGIDFKDEYKWEFAVKTDKGLLRGASFEEPTEEYIKSQLPNGTKLLQIISKKELS